MTQQERPAGLVSQREIDPHSFEGFARLGLHLEPVRRVLQRINFRPHETIVDLGGGTGQSTETLIGVIPPDILVTDHIVLVEPSEDINVAKQRLAKYKNVVYKQKDANEFLRGAKNVDQIHFHNAIHLLSDEEKRLHARLARSALNPLGIEVVVTTFIEGGEPEEEKMFYSKWMRESLTLLRANYREVFNKVMETSRTIKAEARKRLSSLDYKLLFEDAHFNVLYCDDSSPDSKMAVTQEGFRKIAAYWLWIKGILPGATADAYDIITEVQQSALEKVWPNFKSPNDVSWRNCALIIAQKPAA